uniref:Transposase Tc1-like domain-containing protein n=1 Tax=Stegastes partitus TaxID=144197 RepID=A0A3B4ZRN3_9TELE
MSCSLCFGQDVQLRAVNAGKEDLVASAVTVRRRLLKDRRPKKKPLLTQKMKKVRLNWCKEHVRWTPEQWKSHNCNFSCIMTTTQNSPREQML